MTGLQQDSPLIEKERALGLTGARVSGLNWYGLGPPWSSTTLMSASRDPGGEKSSTSKEPPGSELPGAAVSLSILLWPEDQWVTPHVLSASSGSFSTLAHFKYFSTFTCRKPQTELGYYWTLVTYEGVQRRIRGHPSHFVDGFKREDVLVVVRTPQGAAGTAAGAQVTRREGCWSTWIEDSNKLWALQT